MINATRLNHMSIALSSGTRDNIRLVRERAPPGDDRQPARECDGNDTTCLREHCQRARHKGDGETAVGDPAYVTMSAHYESGAELRILLANIIYHHGKHNVVVPSRCDSRTPILSPKLVRAKTPKENSKKRLASI